MLAQDPLLRHLILRVHPRCVAPADAPDQSDAVDTAKAEEEKRAKEEAQRQAVSAGLGHGGLQCGSNNRHSARLHQRAPAPPWSLLLQAERAKAEAEQAQQREEEARLRMLEELLRGKAPACGLPCMLHLLVALLAQAALKNAHVGLPLHCCRGGAGGGAQGTRGGEAQGKEGAAEGEEGSGQSGGGAGCVPAGLLHVRLGNGN